MEFQVNLNISKTFRTYFLAGMSSYFVLNFYCCAQK